ncbi:hypothetical protein OH76DRAFT_512265 [Lentinus brumalis]|uniref:Uncharacterized protein n=1 Tax=Lentinus brumalis TaxID=2498619 RepID=A0A371DB85_9APHY|nr:hypothetical protein OH76DRAFT_512265 [Polyporus brumalis]
MCESGDVCREAGNSRRQCGGAGSDPPGLVKPSVHPLLTSIFLLVRLVRGNGDDELNRGNRRKDLCGRRRGQRLGSPSSKSR